MSMVAARETQITRVVIAALSALVIGAVAVLVLRTPPGELGDPVASPLPSINALLNGCAALLLSLGYVFVRRRQLWAHQVCMTTAVVTSTLFLITYVVHHYQVGSVRFGGSGWLKSVYLAVLVPHVLLSAVMVPMVLTTLVHAWRGRLQQHRRIARWTLPVWLYVSVSGVVVYWMLYHLGR